MGTVDAKFSVKNNTMARLAEEKFKYRERGGFPSYRWWRREDDAKQQREIENEIEVI